MTKAAKLWMAVIAALIAVVIALLIVLIVQGANAERQRQFDACDAEYPHDVYLNIMCRNDVE